MVPIFNVQNKCRKSSILLSGMNPSLPPVFSTSYQGLGLLPLPVLTDLLPDFQLLAVF